MLDLIIGREMAGERVKESLETDAARAGKRRAARERATRARPGGERWREITRRSQRREPLTQGALR